MKEIIELNTKHAIVQYEGKTLILNEEMDEERKPKITFSSTSEFEKRYWNKTVAINSKIQKIGKVWLEHQDRRTYQGVVFNPNGAPPTFYNLWNGFQIKPQEKDCRLYLNHIYQVIAAGDSDLAEYILDFMADAVQNPGTKPGVALVLRGDQGVGKGIFVKYFAKLFEPYYAHVTNPNHFLGNFNSILDAKLLVFADEAFWAGDKKAEGILKGLVTEDQVCIERKGLDVKQQKNFIRLIVASNNDWVVPASASERRFCVMDVSDKHKQDVAYFEAICDQMENGGLEGLMHFLLNRDLSSANLRKLPKTSALTDQKMHSMTPIQSWWHDCLLRGSIDCSDFVNDGYPGVEWKQVIPVDLAFGSYINAASKRGMANRLSQAQFGKEFSKIAPVSRVRKTLPQPVNLRTTSSKRGYVYQLHDLEACREFFDDKMGFTTNWEE